jgi:hypothetical protein
MSTRKKAKRTGAARRTSGGSATVLARAMRELGPSPADRDGLNAWLRTHLEVHVPGVALLESSSAGLDYLAHAFFEGRVPVSGGASGGGGGVVEAPPDCVVWANRGGGKTFLGAAATTLDLIYKPGIEVRILGGSLEQSQRMHEHLRRFFERPALKRLLSRKLGAVTQSRLRLANGSGVEILAQSQTAVRGTRVQKLRCDEVDLFDPEVWEAAQLTTRSIRWKGTSNRWVRGSVEALSTMHKPMGLMWQVVGEARRVEAWSKDEPTPGPSLREGSQGEPTPGPSLREGGGARRVLFRWGVVDALEHCPAERACAGCGLESECGGRAKQRAAEVAGHITVDDALTLKGRVSRATWEAEMLCLRPGRDLAVLPEFDPAVHVFEDGPIEREREPRSLLDEPAAEESVVVCGMDFGFRSPTVVLWAKVEGEFGAEGTVRVVDERVVSGVRMEEHVRAICAHGLGRPRFVAADPAGAARNDQTGVSNLTLLRRAGLVVKARPSAILEGVGLLRARLMPAEVSRGPRLFVASRCVKLIEAMQRYHYPDRRETNEPVKDGHDHAVDALRYLVLNVDKPMKTVNVRYV